MDQIKHRVCVHYLMSICGVVIALSSQRLCPSSVTNPPPILSEHSLFLTLATNFLNRWWWQNEKTLSPGTTIDWTWPDDDSCFGHSSGDVFPFATFGDDGEAISNYEVVQKMSPFVDGLDYVFQSFEWAHCTAGYVSSLVVPSCLC